VREIYAEDFEYFGYSRDIETLGPTSDVFQPSSDNLVASILSGEDLELADNTPEAEVIFAEFSRLRKNRDWDACRDLILEHAFKDENVANVQRYYNFATFKKYCHLFEDGFAEDLAARKREVARKHFAFIDESLSA